MPSRTLTIIIKKHVESKFHKIADRNESKDISDKNAQPMSVPKLLYEKNLKCFNINAVASTDDNKCSGT